MSNITLHVRPILEGFEPLDRVVLTSERTGENMVYEILTAEEDWPYVKLGVRPVSISTQVPA